MSPSDNVELTRRAIDAFNWQVLEWRDDRCLWWRNCSTEAEAKEAIASRYL